VENAFEQSNEISTGKVGSVESRLISQRKIVDFTTGYLKNTKKKEE
jgi:aminoglycoside N3'-acetyltransferase